MCGGLSARRVKVLSWRHRGRGHRCGPAWRRDLALVDSVPDEIIGCRVDHGGNDAQVSERLDPRREIRYGEGGLRRIVRASGKHRRDERSDRLADHDQDCNLDDDIGGIASQQEHPAPLVLNRVGEEHGGKAAHDHPDEQDDQEVVEGARHRRLRGWVARDDARGYGKGEADNGHGSNDDADNEQEDGQENVSRMGGAEGFPPEDHQDRADEDQDRTNDSDDRKPPDERADEQEQDPGLRPANLCVTLGLHRGGEPRRAHVHGRGRGRHPTGPCGQGAPAVRTEHRSRTIRRATTRTVDASGQVAPPAAECGTRLKSISKAGKAYSTRDEWMARGRHRGLRPLDLLRTGTAQRRSRYREEEPGRAAQGTGARGPDTGRRRPSVRASGPGPLRLGPDPRRSRRPAPSPHLDRPRRLRRSHPHGRDRREGPSDPRKLRPGIPIPRRPDGAAAFPGNGPDAPLRRRLATRVRLNLLRLLGLLAAGRGRPGVLRDVVVDRAHLLGLFLRLLGLDEFHNSLFPEHPVVDPPLPAVVEGRFLPLRREDAGILQHVEGVPVLRLEDVVDDPLGVAEEVEDVLGHRPGLLLLHPRPVDRVLDRPSQVVDREGAGGTSFGLCLNRHVVSGASYGPPWIFKGSAPPLSDDSHPAPPRPAARRGKDGDKGYLGGFSIYTCGKWRKAWASSGSRPRSPDWSRGHRRSSRASCDSILRTMRHLGLGKEDDFLVDIARLRIEREGAEDIRDWLRVLKEFLVRRYQRERFDLLVIDTMDVLASMAHLEDARNELFHFFHFLRSMGVTTYAIANVEPAGGGISHDVAFLADGVFELRFSGAGEGKVPLYTCVVRSAMSSYR